MHSIWDGSINFGLVNIPIKLYSGSENHEGLDFDLLHKTDHSPIRYARVCRADGKEIPYVDIVKGYEYQKGDYVVLSKEDFEKVNLKRTKNIEIRQFVKESEIDSRYYEKPYYLEPDKNAGKTYALLRDALEQSGKVALASFVIRGRENLAIIKPLKNILVLNQMRFPADLRSPGGIKVPDEKPGKEEIKMALELIDKSTKHFIAEDWHDTYTEELLNMIQAKLKGKHVTTKAEAAKPTEVKDLMKTLKASLK